MSGFHLTLVKASLAMLVGSLALMSPGSEAPPFIPPPYVSDEELAQYPIIVLARWDKAPQTGRHQIEGNVQKEWEVITRIQIERMIQGKVPTGACEILITDRFGWTAKYPRIMTYTSSEMSGDVDDVTQSNLWFFKRGRSWQQDDPKEYLLLDNYRCVQPLKLGLYFDALRGSNPERDVPKHLTSEDPEIVRRVLGFICGGDLSWPYNWQRMSSFETEVRRKRLLTGQADNVLKLTDPKRPAETRQLALAVYAELSGKAGLPKFREFLKDRDGGLRAIAVGVLARARDVEGLDRMPDALAGLDDGWLAYETMQVLGQWDDAGIVPALIALLQNDKLTYHLHQEFSNVALNARSILARRTGVAFPLNVAVSREAWNEVKSIKADDERRHLLELSLRFRAEPLEADVVSRNGRPHVIVRNRSTDAVVVARRPQGITLRCEGGVGGASEGKVTGRDSFKELPPKGTVEIEIDTGDFLDYFLMAATSSREIVLEYLRNGNEFGLNAWMGVVTAKFGKRWTEPGRKEEVVEERWPSGWLKTKGTMVDGRKHGVWTSWREDGRKVKEWEYFNGSVAGLTEFNPEALEPDEAARPLVPVKKPDIESRTPRAEHVSQESSKHLAPPLGTLVIAAVGLVALALSVFVWHRRKSTRYRADQRQ